MGTPPRESIYDRIEDYRHKIKDIEGLLTLLSADHPVIRKTREQIDREKAKGGKERVAVRG